ncbi:hypothetical protein [Streptodolium elevatio]
MGAAQVAAKRSAVAAPNAPRGAGDKATLDVADLPLRQPLDK